MKLSFILPVYNVSPWLRACLDSVQLEDGVEIICVDDGSTDGTGEILDEYAGRVKVVHQENAGVSAARNKALALATGEYISFLDPDDVLRAGAVEEMLAHIREFPNADIISYANVQFDDGDAPLWSDTNQIKVIDVSKEIGEEVMRMCVCGCTYKKEILPPHGFMPYCVGEDLVFVGECLCQAEKVILSSHVLYGYRQRRGSATNSNISIRKLIDDNRYCRKLIEVLSNSDKQIDSRIYRRLGLRMTEGYVGSICDFSLDETKGLWSRWYDTLAWMKGKRIFSPWTSLVVCICFRIQLKILAYVLCLLPLRLKQMGFHR